MLAVWDYHPAFSNSGIFEVSLFDTQSLHGYFCCCELSVGLCFYYLPISNSLYFPNSWSDIQHWENYKHLIMHLSVHSLGRKLTAFVFSIGSDLLLLVQPDQHNWNIWEFFFMTNTQSGMKTRNMGPKEVVQVPHNETRESLNQISSLK